MKKISALIAAVTLAINLNIVYPSTLEVIDIVPENGTIVLQSAGGFLYEYFVDDTSDIVIGEYYSAIMTNSNMTQTIKDDEILFARFSGFVNYTTFGQ